jgi:hypothetical protein
MEAGGHEMGRTAFVELSETIRLRRLVSSSPLTGPSGHLSPEEGFARGPDWCAVLSWGVF